MPDDRRKIFEWLAHAGTTSGMPGPACFADNFIPAQEEFTNDYSLHFFDDQTADNGRSYNYDTVIIIKGAG